MNKLDYPNPIFIRENIEILDGKWDFSFDNNKWIDINVPFCPESKLSGIGYTDFIPKCYYKKKFIYKQIRERLYLHFGAVDFATKVYINNQFAGEHKGGYTPFSFDITNLVNIGKNEIFVDVQDDDLENQARGKQSSQKNSFGCFYTRTTGIWQSVWLEYTAFDIIENFSFYPDIQNCSVDVDLRVSAKGKYEILVLFDNKIVGKANGDIAYRDKIYIPLSEKHLWSIGNGRLYDVIIKYGEDTVYSYFGLRSTAYNGMEYLLNGENVFQKLVLDQGYNPDGIYTAPNVAFMENDIDLAINLGFNGSRLHQKVFDPKFLYLCDKKGFMVWGEFPSWGIDYSSLDSCTQFLSEWKEVIERDFNHPCIVMWCPLNEVWENNEKNPDIKYIECVYDFTKILDETRPCVDVSGGYHSKTTDLFDFHCYQTIEDLKKYLDNLQKSDVLDVPLLYGKTIDIKYKKGCPVQISEFGGFAFFETKSNIGMVNEGAVKSEDAWGYGVKTDVLEIVNLVNLIYSYDKISGFCYTQLYDVEQEQNGIYYYDRSEKISRETMKEIYNAIKFGRK